MSEAEGAFLALLLTVWCRATNHRPRNDRRGRSRVPLYADDQPADEQIVAAKAAVEERRRLQELALRTRKGRLDLIVRALLDDVFDRLGFDNPTGNVKDAVARHPYNAVIAGIATFEGRRWAGTLPPDVGPRYLLCVGGAEAGLQNRHRRADEARRDAPDAPRGHRHRPVAMSQGERELRRVHGMVGGAEAGGLNSTRGDNMRRTDPAGQPGDPACPSGSRTVAAEPRRLQPASVTIQACAHDQ